MHKSIVFALCGCFLSLGAFAQPASMDRILKQVEQNNNELKALAEYRQSKRLELKSGNNLPDPQLGAYFLPLGEHGTGAYTEFQITQSIEFPSVYRAQGSLIEQQVIQLELEYMAKRQEILAQVKGYCLNLVYLNKRMETEALRVEQARRVFEQVQELYEKEQVGILELNKSKVAWMQEQFKIQQIESEKKSLGLLLTNLNGGNDISFSSGDYESPMHLDPADSLWQEKQARDPELTQLMQQEAIAQRSLRLAMNKSLPNLTAGYNRQGVSGSYYSGVFAGVSLPIWSNRNKVKAAQSMVDFQQSFASSKMMQAHALFEKEYNDYQIKLAKYREYAATLSDLNSDKLLLQAYQLGEMSFLEYYMELHFYRQAYDAMLEMQYQLFVSQSQLLKHQL